jgi:hypothetical protein
LAQASTTEPAAVAVAGATVVALPTAKTVSGPASVAVMPEPGGWPVGSPLQFVGLGAIVAGALLALMRGR